MSRTVRSLPRHDWRWDGIVLADCGDFNSQSAKRKRRRIVDDFVACRHRPITSMVTASYADANPDWDQPYQAWRLHKAVFRSGKTRIRAQAEKIMKAAEHQAVRAKHMSETRRLIFEYWEGFL